MTTDTRDNARMFDDIAGSYDCLNHLLSLNIDRSWRRKAIRMLKPFNPRQILDVATGTGDFAIAALSLNPDHITGVDVSAGMLGKARVKIGRKGYDNKISLVRAPSESLPFQDNSFDAATVAFGVRNFDDPVQGLSEIHRVLKPGGVLAVLEFSLPEQKLLLQAYRFYFHRILPVIGKVISKDMDAYLYLPESVEAFSKGKEFVGLLDRAGFKGTACRLLTAGICGLYSGTK